MAANPEMDLELKLPYDDVHLDEKTEKSILESIGPAGAQFKDGPIELSRFLMFCGLSASDVKLVWKENCRIPGSVTQKLINEGGIPKIIAVMKSHFLRLQKFGESKGFFVMLHVINQLQEYGHVFRRILGRSKEFWTIFKDIIVLSESDEPHIVKNLGEIFQNCCFLSDACKNFFDELRETEWSILRDSGFLRYIRCQLVG
eukprot:969387_1